MEQINEYAKIQLQEMILADGSQEIQELYKLKPNYKIAREHLRSELQTIVKNTKFIK